ncbi:MAG TPA: hypothetical protein VLH08_21085 [Acidobacteriota bacterium]|nr:hypothetical protein [Acidobacteriota bacterium]
MRCFHPENVFGSASELGRILFTFDGDFLVLANRWRNSGKSFAGIVYAHEMVVTVRQFIEDLELLTNAAEPFRPTD